jgi:fucose 4-O-acetylase-like acetyltransferase
MEVNVLSVSVKKSDRIVWIDIIKGFAIFLVVFGHETMRVTQQSFVELTKYIYSFHIPLFFVISGMLFVKNGTFNEYIIKKIKTIIIPYVSFSILLYVFWLVVGRHVSSSTDVISPLVAFLGIFYGQPKYMPWNPPMWFLLCLFIVNCLFYILHTDKKKTIIYIIVFALIGYISRCLPYRLPWMIDTAFTAFSLYGIGFILKDFVLNDRKTENKNCNIILILFLLIFGFVTSVINGRVEMASIVYSNYILFFVSAISSSLAYILIAKAISNLKIFIHFINVITYFGKNSMIILICHGRAGTVLKCIYVYILGINYNDISMIHKFVFSLLIMLICVPAINIFNNYFPFMLGKSKEKIKNKKWNNKIIEKRWYLK